LVNAAKSRVQQLALLTMRAPHVMLVAEDDLIASEDWLLYNLCNYSSNRDEFLSMKQPRSKVS
jgi:hypothetical protein